MNINDLEISLGKACDASNAPIITEGRKEILSMPKDFVIQNVHKIAEKILDLNDEWHFRRLLELYSELNDTLLYNLIEIGLKNPNIEIVEAANDFKK